MERFVDLGALAGETEAVLGDEDVEPLEERAEKVTPGAVGQALVQLPGLLQEIDRGVDAVDASLNARAGAGELLCDGTLLEGNRFEAFAELAAGEFAVSGEVDEPILLRLKLDELLTECILFWLFGHPALRTSGGGRARRVSSRG